MKSGLGLDAAAPPAADVIAAANQRDIPVVLVTNQAGLAADTSAGTTLRRCRTRFRRG